MGQIVVRKVTANPRRRELYSLLSSRIVDQTLYEYLPASTRRIGDTHEVMFEAVTPAGDTVGAAYAGPDWTDVAELRARGRFPPAAVADYREHILVLHGIATTGESAGRGVGSALLAAVETHALQRSCRAVIGVTDPSAAGFYMARGFHVLPRRCAIAVAAYDAGEPAITAWPIEGESRWFAKAFVDGQVVGESDGRSVRRWFSPTQSYVPC